MDYQSFLSRKQLYAESYGFDVRAEDVNRHAFDWQRDIIVWALRRGRAATFADCGLGKTLMQLEWARWVCACQDLDVLIVCPLTVAHQTERQARQFDIAERVTVCKERADVRRGINITNYERLHKFDLSNFGGVVLDESSILKGLTKTRQVLTDAFRSTRFKLCCTATPSPNDTTELGNHSEFLGVMPRSQMLGNWFVHDSSSTQDWRLKGHAKKDFWRWVSTWAISVSKPSDLGYSDDGYGLPELRIHEHIVDPPQEQQDGYLFPVGGISSTNLHEEKRATAAARAAEVARLVDPREPWLIWCHTDYEADALKRAIPASAEVRGSHKMEVKEHVLNAFSNGDIKTLITKPSIAGFGLNWQHCNKMAFVGLNYSFESFYQAIRRCWRFLQENPVDVHFVSTPAEHAISRTVFAKDELHQMLKTEMAELMRDAQIEQMHQRRGNARTSFSQPIRRPQWLASTQ